MLRNSFKVEGKQDMVHLSKLNALRKAIVKKYGLIQTLQKAIDNFVNERKLM